MGAQGAGTQGLFLQAQSWEEPTGAPWEAPCLPEPAGPLLRAAWPGGHSCHKQNREGCWKWEKGEWEPWAEETMPQMSAEELKPKQGRFRRKSGKGRHLQRKIQNKSLARRDWETARTAGEYRKDTWGHLTITETTDLKTDTRVLAPRREHNCHSDNSVHMPRAYRAPGKVLDSFQSGKGKPSYKQVAYITQISAT